MRALGLCVYTEAATAAWAVQYSAVSSWWPEEGGVYLQTRAGCVLPSCGERHMRNREGARIWAIPAETVLHRHCTLGPRHCDARGPLELAHWGQAPACRMEHSVLTGSFRPILGNPFVVGMVWCGESLRRFQISRVFNGGSFCGLAFSVRARPRTQSFTNPLASVTTSSANAGSDDGQAANAKTCKQEASGGTNSCPGVWGLLRLAPAFQRPLAASRG